MAKKREKKLRKKIDHLVKKAYRESKDVSEYFFKSIEVKEKYDPYSRAKIRLDPCVYCGSNDHPLRTVDHIRAKAKHGSNLLDNLASSCGPCNNAKGPRDLLEYLLIRRYGPEG